MHFIVPITLLFAACAAAAKQGGGDAYQPFYPSHPRQWGGRGRPWGRPSQPPTDYRVGCTCDVDQSEDPDTGSKACDQLASIWGNLYWDDWNQACMDDAHVGLDVNGFMAACQRAAHGDNYDSFNPVNAEANCSPK